MRVTRRRELVVNHLVTRTYCFETIACRNVTAGLDARRFGQVLQGSRIERSVESHLQFRRSRIPGGNRLGRLAIIIANTPEFAFAVRAASPVGLSAVGSHDQVASRRNAGIHGQRLQGCEEMGLRHITRGGLYQLRAPEFAARVTRHNGIGGARKMQKLEEYAEK